MCRALNEKLFVFRLAGTKPIGFFQHARNVARRQLYSNGIEAVNREKFILHGNLHRVPPFINNIA